LVLSEYFLESLNKSANKPQPSNQEKIDVSILEERRVKSESKYQEEEKYEIKKNQTEVPSINDIMDIPLCQSEIMYKKSYSESTKSKKPYFDNYECRDLSQTLKVKLYLKNEDGKIKFMSIPSYEHLVIDDIQNKENKQNHKDKIEKNDNVKIL